MANNIYRENFHQGVTLLEKRTGKSIQTAFILNVILLIGLLLIGLLLSVQAALNAIQIKNGLEEQVHETLKARSGEIAGELNQRLLQVGQKTFGLALAVSNMSVGDIDAMYRIADGFILSDSLIIGSGIWFEPYAYQKDLKYFGPYRHRTDNNSIHLTMIYSNAEYDYFVYSWYQNAMHHSGRVAWTGPFLDEVTDIIMLSTACTIRKNGKDVGCVTIDIGLKELIDYIQQIRIGKNGYAMLVNEKGVCLAHRDDPNSLCQKLSQKADPLYEEIDRKIVNATEVSLFEEKIAGTRNYIMVSPLCIDNMKLVLVAPKSDYMDGIWHSLLLSAVMMLFVMCLLCFAIHSVFKRRVGEPIRRLMDAADRIARGGMAEFRTSSEDEFGHLSSSIQEMAKTLNHRNKLLVDQFHLLEKKNRQLETALQNVESMRMSRDIYKLESETDTLTGLLNKITTERFSCECLTQLQPGKLAALFVLDLDHFKEANDTYGHQYGDAILQTFAKELRKGFRPDDIVGRFGGDEFIVMISGLPDRSIAERKASYILDAARRLEVEGRNACVTVSIGLALAPCHGTTYEELFQKADDALYCTKKDGRNGYTFSGESTVH